MLAQSDASLNAKKEESSFRQALHHVGEKLHLRSPAPVEDVPPPVPPKDEKWLVNTVNKAVPADQEPDRSFWDKVSHKYHRSKTAAVAEEDEAEAVSISVPADAALKHLGIQGDDSELQAKKNYFLRMAERVKVKFDEDDSDSDSDSDSDGADHKPKTEQEKLERKERKKLAPKVDPKEMREAHLAIYGQPTGVDPTADLEADKKLFGSWWGCHPRRSRAERKLAKQQEAEKERQRVLEELAAQRRAEEEAAAAAAKAEREAAEAAKRKWWQLKAPETPEQKTQKAKEKQREEEKKERKSTSRKHQAIAAAGTFKASS
ncbi:hypothetical protein BC939DRAFT_467342 [Gamsiella multidivaricata]|uniref:uncharacterized protein n=1 Tax=Gamsiella multidivaricata TaxID=101098 RepID=UPI00221F31E6|nr:uncharacterized protein BC939DRAFT_467342 [Gamsiella multidivaricata]KAI7816960.1 hypothetical protein BC939DRAFT_467342 [Gamsiella multidivaricata]